MNSKYTKYKFSGVEEIGEIPRHWESIRLGMLGIFSSSGIDKKIIEGEPLVQMINYTDIVKNRKHKTVFGRDVDFMVVSSPQSRIEEHRLNKGDLVLLPSSETDEDLGLSSLIDFDEEIVFSYHIIRFQFTREVYHYFKKYLVNHYTVLKQFSSEGKGTTRQIIGRNVLRNVVVVLPTISEQKEIVKYLDEKTSHIDNLILNTERKIELLQKKRISLISWVVTKGLNSKIKFKESGSDWIGKVPSDWDIVKLKFLFRIIKIISGELGHNVLSVTQKGIKIKNLDSNEGQHSMDYSKYQIVQKGQFVMNHMDLLTGFIDISKFEGVTSPDYRVFESSNLPVNKKYYLYIFQYCYWNRIFYSLGQGVSNLGRWRLPSDEFKDFLLPYPEVEEQNRIVDFLDKKTQDIDTLISIEQRRIDTLKEYRQSLISEVVTGKVRVCKEDLSKKSTNTILQLS